MLPAWWLPFACFTSSAPQNPIPCTPLLVSLLWFKIWNSRSGRTQLSLHFGWRFRISALSPGLRAGQVLHPQITLQPEAELMPAATAPDDLPTLLVWPESWANLLRDYMCPIPTAWPRAAIPWISCHIFHWIPSTHTLGTCLGTLLMYKSGDMTISFFFHILKTQGYFPISSITKISPFSIDPCMRHMKGHRFPFPSLQCVCLLSYVLGEDDFEFLPSENLAQRPKKRPCKVCADYEEHRAFWQKLTWWVPSVTDFHLYLDEAK